MSQTALPNGEFLGGFLTDPAAVPEKVLLPHELAAVQEAYDKRIQDFGKVIQEKISVTGGDDWHDGAFRATDAQANILSESVSAMAPYLEAQVVDYPAADEPRVTLGSRVVVKQNGFAFPVDVIGYRAAYPSEVVDPVSGEEVTGTSVESPLGRAIMGKLLGDETSYQNGERTMRVVVTGLSQTAIREYFRGAEARQTEAAS
jgi:transcription elongation GreA/GreB family factor